MDELEYRRRCIAQPFDQDPEFLCATAETAERVKFAQQRAEFDEQLKDVMENVEVPRDLAARIRFKHVTRQRAAQRRQWKGFLAMAATVVMAVIGIKFGLQTSSSDLQNAVLAHINGELHFLEVQQNIQNTSIQSLLKPMGGQLNGKLENVRYAGPCTIQKHNGIHMIMQGKAGPVTVLIMPNAHVHQRHDVADQRFEGIIVPTAKGSIAIVGEHGESLRTIEQQLNSAVVWQL